MMKPRIRSALLVVNLMKDDSKDLVQEIDAYLSALGLAVHIVELKGEDDFDSSRTFEQVDVAFSLGGDGTVLFSSRVLSPLQVPILALNLGDFGFITEVSKDEWKVVFDQYANGELGISERLMLEVDVFRDGNNIGTFIGLNDAVISAAGISKVVRLSVCAGDTVLGTYRADGVIVSTPTGSTAYSAAAGGPILDPEMEAIILNPICPFTLSNRPIVLNAEEPVYIDVQEGQRTEVILTIDGQQTVSLMPHDRIRYRRADCKAKIIRSHTRNFFEVLRTKLNWSGGPDA